MEYKFNKKNIVKIEKIGNQGLVFRNEKCVYAFKGESKIYENVDKKGNLISLTLKIKSTFNHTYYIALTENENFIRNSIISILPFLIKFKNESKYFLKKLGE